jgi:YGGT family protein
MLSNQSPAPTAPPNEPLQPTAPIRPQALTYQPVEPLQTSVLAPLQSRPTVSVADRAAMITYLIVGVVEALIISRVILKLLAANPEAGFVRVIYDRSALFVAPFQGIFPTPATQNSVLELSSLVAIAVYALIALTLVRLIAIFGQRQSLL